MNEKKIFEMAIGIAGTPWKVTDIILDKEKSQLNIYLNFAKGSRFARPSDGKLCPVYDKRQRSWRHLNFFQYECYLHAPVPRIDCGEDIGIKTVQVPWARPDSGFTLLMESMIMMLCSTGMTVAEAGRVVGENAHKLWRTIFHHVDKANGERRLEDVKRLTLDETSLRKGHEYVTVVCEPLQKKSQECEAKPTRLLYVTEGKDSSTVQRAREFLEEHGAKPDQIEHVCADMSKAYKKGVKENFKQAVLVNDYFHMVKIISDGVDKVRKRESKSFPSMLKGTKYLWLTNEENLKPEKREQRQRLCNSKLQTAKAYCHLSAFQDIIKTADVNEAISGLKWWYFWVTHSRIPEMKRAAKTIKENWDGIIAYLNTRLTNGPAEAVNGLIQTAKRKARGFKSFIYFSAAIHLVGANLKFNLPSPVPTNPH